MNLIMALCVECWEENHGKFDATKRALCLTDTSVPAKCDKCSKSSDDILLDIPPTEIAN